MHLFASSQVTPRPFPRQVVVLLPSTNSPPAWEQAERTWSRVPVKFFVQAKASPVTPTKEEGECEQGKHSRLGHFVSHDWPAPVDGLG
jgi:hypothetical protein